MANPAIGHLSVFSMHSEPESFHLVRIQYQSTPKVLQLGLGLLTAAKKILLAGWTTTKCYIQVSRKAGKKRMDGWKLYLVWKGEIPLMTGRQMWRQNKTSQGVRNPDFIHHQHQKKPGFSENSVSNRILFIGKGASSENKENFDFWGR